MTGNGHNTQEELASYAMQNLPVEDSASIRAHLQGCAECRKELAEVSGDLALLGMAVEQHPLPHGRPRALPEEDCRLSAVKQQGNAGRSHTHSGEEHATRTRLLGALDGGRRDGDRGHLPWRTEPGFE